MDTREKIIPIERVPEVLTGGEWIIIVGLFDPMTASQARRIAEHGQGGRKLLAVVLADGDTLMPADARAALVAGLRAVNAVTVARAGGWQSAVPANVAVPVEEIHQEHARTAEFVQFVLDRAARSSGAER